MIFTFICVWLRYETHAMHPYKTKIYEYIGRDIMNVIYEIIYFDIWDSSSYIIKYILLTLTLTLTPPPPPPHTHTHTQRLNTGTSKQIRISWKRSIFFVTHFIKWNTYIIHYTLSEICQAFISWIFDDYARRYFKHKCQASEKFVYFYVLNTWLGLFLHELLHQCGVTWRQLACGIALV